MTSLFQHLSVLGLVAATACWTVHLADSVPPPAPAPSASAIAEPIPEYAKIKTALAQGWNTWHTRSVLTHALLPEGFAVNLAFRQTYWLGGRYLREALIGRGGKDSERVRPGLHALDGSYTELELAWEQVDVEVRTATVDDDLVVLIRPKQTPKQPVHLVVESAMLWNRPGALALDGEALVATLPSRTVSVHTTGRHDGDPYHQTFTPHLSVLLDGPIGLSTGKPRTLAQIEAVTTRARDELTTRAAAHGKLSEAYLAVEAGLAWNTVYDPMYDRVVTTVGRLWNEERGGFSMFGWDNFFMAYMTALYDRKLAFGNIIEQIRGRTEEGFVPNDNQANGRKSWDRSQPPVGAIMVREVYRRFPERWFLEATFEGLLEWNRWWPQKRMNGELLAWGSHEAKNPLGEPNVRTMVTARYESGMDDSPMYEDVPFDRERGVMELQDVGLNALYVADCRALAELAKILGRDAERKELESRANKFSAALEPLWDEKLGLYLNRRSDTGKLSRRLSPTLFYPLLAAIPSAERAKRIVDDHLLNPDEFWGKWVLPSIARSDRSFPKQRYWKGAIWPPLNFLSYLSLRQAGRKLVATQLAEKSLELFISEWKRLGYVSENYSALDGTGDDERLSSDTFHTWGALMGFMALIDAGSLAAPEAPLEQE